MNLAKLISKKTREEKLIEEMRDSVLRAFVSAMSETPALTRSRDEEQKMLERLAREVMRSTLLHDSGDRIVSPATHSLYTRY